MSNPVADRDFAGALRVSIVNCHVIKRAALICLGVFMVFISLRAEAPAQPSFQQLSRYQPENLTTTDSVALLQRLPMLFFLDKQFLSASSELAPIPTVDEVFPTVFLTAAQKPRLSAGLVDPKDAGKTMEPPERHPIYYSGEIGTYFGHASGRVHGDAFGSYLESTVGDDHVQITIGASYDQFNGRGPRRGW